MSTILNMAVSGAGNVYTLMESEYDNPLASTITSYSAAVEFQSDAWGEAVMCAYNAAVKTGDEWKAYYQSAEEEQASKREQSGETIKRTKAGKVVASAVFPKTWNTDKSIIGKALDAGVELVDAAGNPVPKTAMQDAYKEVNKDSKSDMQKIQTVIATYGNIYAKLAGKEKEQARIMIGIVHTS